MPPNPEPYQLRRPHVGRLQQHRRCQRQRRHNHIDRRHVAANSVRFEGIVL